MLKTSTLFLLLIVSYSAFSQEKPVHQKKMYKAPDGKLYIQKDLPVYLWLSTSKNQGSEKNRLFSEESKPYSNPMYFDTEGYNTVRSPSAVDTITHKTVYPMRDIIFEVYADSRAPVTKIDYGETEIIRTGDIINVGTGTSISLEATDQLSGVENIYYSINGSPYTAYTKPIEITEEKEYLLLYYSVDNVGNVEQVHEVVFIYDKSPPVSKLEIDGDRYENIVSARSKIVLTADDSGVGVGKILYRIDEGQERQYSNPLLAGNLSQDDHTILYYSEDRVGNKEKSDSFSFYVDRTPPTIIEEIIGKSFFSGGKEFSSGKSQLKLTSFDNKAGVKEVRYSVNNGEYQIYDKPVFLTQTSGNLIIKSYAVDNVNNRSNSQTANEKTSIPYIDLTGPELTHVLTGPKFTTRDTTFINYNTKITLRGNDAESGMNRIEYMVDGDGPKEFSEAFVIQKEGYSEIDYTGYDNVENTSSESFGIKIDHTGPELSYSFGTSALGKRGERVIYPSHTVLFVSATDRVVGFKSMTYSLNGSAPKNYNGVITNLPKGDNEITIVAYDQLENATELIFSFIIE